MPEGIPELGQSLILIIRIAIIVFTFLYVLFAAAVIKQVKVMIETLEVGFETPVKIMSFGHFVFSIVVFLLSIFIL